ncbi:hypothetical protein EZS27_015728 [termite gut metagenome]|uniref:ISL3 family transposase n=1 Tax=termite gut metagenome TaxID=433724 RepID=A0A5J4RT07_9ZZZZ
MNSTEIFSIALGLVPPWKISDVRFETTTTSAHELHIYLVFEEGYELLSMEKHTIKVKKIRYNIS